MMAQIGPLFMKVSLFSQVVLKNIFYHLGAALPARQSPLLQHWNTVQPQWNRKAFSDEKYWLINISVVELSFYLLFLRRTVCHPKDRHLSCVITNVCCNFGVSEIDPKTKCNLWPKLGPQSSNWDINLMQCLIWTTGNWQIGRVE